jgi:hypothetical protein
MYATYFILWEFGWGIFSLAGILAICPLQPKKMTFPSIKRKKWNSWCLVFWI